jgi:hypothetical protein
MHSLQTKRPESRKRAAIKKVSLKATNRLKPLHFAGSTIGKACHQRGTATKELATGGASGR